VPVLAADLAAVVGVAGGGATVSVLMKVSAHPKNCSRPREIDGHIVHF
jgi:hypothetical protein